MRKLIRSFLIPMLLLSLCLSCVQAEDLIPAKRYETNEKGECVIDDVPLGHLAPADPVNRVFYEIFTGSFSDSDGDGIGDLRGIIQRMDYLNDGKPDSGLSLGVEGIWLTPVFASRSYHKYDVDDYYTIDPAFGTMEDLKELISLCHERDVKLILDLPINHTSASCRWYKNFTNARLMHNPANDYYDFYTCIPSESTAPAGRHFMPVRGLDISVEANFSDQMPELNFDNPRVRQTVLDVAAFYLSLGVDGFRFDAAKYIYLGDDRKSADFWCWYMEELKKIKPDVYAVAEVWDSDGITDLYAPAVNCFNFTLAQTSGLIAETAKHGDSNRFTAYIEKRQEHLKSIRADAVNVLFISNHDMDRSAGYLTVASGYMKMAANLYLLSPGSPFIYYGEEIGLRGSRGGANTDANRRLAMLWGDGDTVRDPVGASYDRKNQTAYSVQDLLGSDDGILNYYKKLILLRKANPEIARGEYRALSFPGTKVGGFVSAWQGETVLVIHNTTGSAKTVDLKDADAPEADHIAGVIGAEGAELNGTCLSIGAQTSVILR